MAATTELSKQACALMEAALAVEDGLHFYYFLVEVRDHLPPQGSLEERRASLLLEDCRAGLLGALGLEPASSSLSEVVRLKSSSLRLDLTPLADRLRLGLAAPQSE